MWILSYFLCLVLMVLSWAVFVWGVRGSVSPGVGPGCRGVPVCAKPGMGGGSVTCAWGFALQLGGTMDILHGLETVGFRVEQLGEGLTLDAEAELLLLVGDVAGDSPDECHGQATGNASNCPCLCHCGDTERAW